MSKAPGGTEGRRQGVQHRKCYGQYSFRVTEATLWNKLPALLGNTDVPLYKFKKAAKIHYFDELQVWENVFFVFG